MIFGIVVEGPADAAAYSTLIPRIRPAVESVLSRPCGGKSPLKENFVGFLKEFRSWPVEKALVIRDSDCRDPRAVEEKLQQRLHESGFHPPFPLHFYATSCMLDAWLLADEGAVNQVARQRGKAPVRSTRCRSFGGQKECKGLIPTNALPSAASR